MNEDIKKQIIKWIFDNHFHHDNVDDCDEAESPFVNSLDLEKFIESL